MEKKENTFKDLIKSATTDVAYVIASVFVVGLTFLTMTKLTPDLKKSTGTNAQVLGESSKKQNINIYSGKDSNLPFISSYVINYGTEQQSTAKITMAFKKLQSTVYSINTATVNNPSSEIRKLRITPNYSLNGQYVTISITFDGMQRTLIQSDGLVQPLDISLIPNSSSDILIELQANTDIATPSTLELSLVEIE